MEHGTAHRDIAPELIAATDGRGTLCSRRDSSLMSWRRRTEPGRVRRSHSKETMITSSAAGLRSSPQESVAPDSQEIRLFLRTAAAAFHGRRCKRWHRGCTRLSYVLQIIRAVHRSDDRDSGALAMGGLFAQETWKNLVCRIDQYSCLSAVSEKKTGGRRCGAGSAMKYDQAPYMHCTNLGWLV